MDKYAQRVYEACRNHVTEILGSPERGEAWMQTKREDFDGRSAEELIQEGRGGMVEDYISRIEFGVR